MSVASRIAAELLSEPALLGLRTRRLVPDIRDRFGCCWHTAVDAVSMARRRMNQVVDSRGTATRVPA